MSYISSSDLLDLMSERVLIELSNDSVRADSVNWQLIESLCNQASELVDGYLRSLYILPLDATPTIIKSLCKHLVRFELYSRRSEGSGKTFPENVKITYNDAIKTLEKIQQGKLHLGIAAKQTQNNELQSTSRFRVKGAKPLDLNGY